MLSNFNEYLEALPSYAGIFLLMLSGFLLGYFGAILLLKKKYRELSDKLKKELNSYKAESSKNKDDIETLFSEIKPRIIEVVKQTQQTDSQEQVLEFLSSQKRNKVEDPAPEKQENVPEKARSTYLKYQMDKPELDFDSIGYADHDQKDDLTRIMGIGPYIEQKLNEIGICNYDQISRLNESDIHVVTELIDFFPGRIERDNWVGQARALKVS